VRTGKPQAAASEHTQIVLVAHAPERFAQHVGKLDAVRLERGEQLPPEPRGVAAADGGRRE
jgi:hypothetical protein